MKKIFFKRFFFLVLFGILFFGIGNKAHAVNSTTNISATTTEHWAWNDVIGWMDWYNTTSIMVTSLDVTGYASSSAGLISLDCANPINICGASNYKVLNDKVGNLSGWGWSDAYGWVSFCGGQGTSDCPGTGVSYRVLIDPDTGEFSGYAWNDIVGWVSFNCLNYSGCGISTYKVVTSWRGTSTIGMVDSATFDTGVSGGAQLNSLVWSGLFPAFTSVRFKVATSNSSTGPWSFIGPDGSVNTYYTGNPGVSIPLDYTLHANQRYFRYRVILLSNKAQTVSPRVDDIVVNWSP